MTTKNPHDVPCHVSRCLQLAILLEVSAYPKPGNVHRTSDFEKTRYEHFLASAVAVAPHFRHAAEQGVHISKKEITRRQARIGKTIRDAVEDILVWQHGGNTLLGSIMLLVPVATAAGITLAENTKFSVGRLRTNLKCVCETTTAEDTVNVYKAIGSAQPGGLGKTPRLDVTDGKSQRKILEEGINLSEVFKISSSWDSISAEWVSSFHVTFDIGYPFFKQQLDRTRNVNIATVHTYLKILSEVPDTLIMRKSGVDNARWVSSQAKEILEIGGLTTELGRKSAVELDKKLHDKAHKLNPGTTADKTSAVLSIAVLGGYRP